MHGWFAVADSPQLRSQSPVVDMDGNADSMGHGGDGFRIGVDFQMKDRSVATEYRSAMADILSRSLALPHGRWRSSLWKSAGRSPGSLRWRK